MSIVMGQNLHEATTSTTEKIAYGTRFAITALGTGGTLFFLGDGMTNLMNQASGVRDYSTFCGADTLSFMVCWGAAIMGSRLGHEQRNAIGLGMISGVLAYGAVHANEIGRVLQVLVTR